MFAFFGGFRLMNEVADTLGVDRAIFKAVLTEAGVDYGFVKAQFNSTVEAVGNRRSCLDALAQELVEPALQGVQKIRQKFPEEGSIRTRELALTSFYENSTTVNSPSEALDRYRGA